MPIMRTEIHIEDQNTFKVNVRYFDSFATVQIEVFETTYHGIHTMTYYFTLDKVEEFIELFRSSKLDIATHKLNNENGDK